MSIEKTGIPELDRLMESGDALDIEPMVIDKSQFDNVILPLLLNSVNLPIDDVFDHLKNIWVNYYKSSTSSRELVYKDKPNNPMNIHGNGIFTPMKIVDVKGEAIAITPALVEPSMIVGINNVLEEYSLESKSNPDIAKIKLVNSVKAYKLGGNTKWVKFLETYDTSVVKPIDSSTDISYHDLADNGIMED